MARKKPVKTKEPDGLFVLKLLLYVILSMQWLWLVDDGGRVEIALPVGPVIGLLFASHEHFQIDKKIEYTVLLIGGAVSLLLGVGIYLTI